MRAAALLLLAVSCAPSGPVATSPSPSVVVTTVAPTTAPPTTAPPTTAPPTTPPASPTRTPTARPTTSAPSPCPVPGARPATVVSHGPSARRTVALTFDAGSDAGSTAAILDALARAGAVASFGVTGDFARANPGLVARMHRDGHQIVNHSDAHSSFTGVSSDRVVLTQAARCTDLRRAERAIAAAAPGTSVRPWFRPPYGDRDATVDRDVAAAGYRYVVLWNVDASGWRGVPVAQVVRTCLDAAAPGDIYLFHVGGASTDAAALPQVLAGLRTRGYGFATLTGLLS